MHGHMSRCTVTCHDARSHECKKKLQSNIFSQHKHILVISTTMLSTNICCVLTVQITLLSQLSLYGYTVYCLLSIVYCLLSIAYCLLSIVSCLCLLFIVYCLLSIVYCLLPIVSCLLSISLVYCLLPIVYCLSSIAYCLLSIVYCLLSIVYRLLMQYDLTEFITL
jgi:hypothetical protein